MQRFSYKLLKFSELDGPYRGANQANDELEVRVNRQLDELAVQNWKVKTFTVHYVGGRIIYTVLLERELEGGANSLPEASEMKRLAESAAENVVNEGSLTRPIPPPTCRLTATSAPSMSSVAKRPKNSGAGRIGR